MTSTQISLPIVHIDKLCENLGITRDWVNRNWLQSETPPPHFRNGGAVFFPLKDLEEWASSRCSRS